MINIEPAITAKNICKKFGAVTALHDVNFSAYPSEVMALVGDNGCGKSTLTKILSGAEHPDTGEIYISGKQHVSLTPQKALHEGVSAVYQDLALDPMKNCAENLFLGRELTHGQFWLDKRKMHRMTKLFFEEIGIQVQDIEMPVGLLSGGQRQAVAIARALYCQTPIMIFDEPTSAMGVRESSQTLELITKLREKNVAVIIISHNLFQVFDIADKVTVMSAGKVLVCHECKNSNPREIHDLILSEGGGKS